MLTTRKKLTLAFIILVGILITAPTLFAQQTGARQTRRKMGRAALHQNIPNLTPEQLWKTRPNLHQKRMVHRYDLRKRLVHKKRAFFNTRRKSHRFGYDRRNCRFGR
jgi:hypothetical protein